MKYLYFALNLGIGLFVARDLILPLRLFRLWWESVILVVMVVLVMQVVLVVLVMLVVLVVLVGDNYIGYTGGTRGGGLNKEAKLFRKSTWSR